MPYITRALAWDDDLGLLTEGDRTVTVHEPDTSPQLTGLVDRHGSPIYRYEERQPIGFRLGAAKC